MLERARLDAIVEAAVGEGRMPNLVLCAADRAGIRYQGAAGTRVFGDGGSGQVGPASLYRLGSMTKLPTVVAALQLVERGLLDLDAPVADYLADAAHLQVLEGFDGDTPVLRPPARAVLVRHLSTHTSGLSYAIFSENQRRYQAVTGCPDMWSGDARAFGAPLDFDPGTAWRYGLGVDWLGRVVEALTGRSLAEVLATEITGPLGMTHTTFAPGPAERAGCVPVQIPVGYGLWEVSAVELPEHPDWWSGGHGLYGTPQDYLKLCQMLLGGGALNGVRVLTAASVEEMFADQIAPLEIPANVPTNDPAIGGESRPRPGFGHCLALTKADIPGMRSAGSGSFGGLYHTNFVVDRTQGLTWVVFSQCLPGGMPQSLALNESIERELLRSR